MSNLDICKQAAASLTGEDGKLLGYQKASANAIHEHLKTHQKALLADEVGLGKTYIAMAVVAQMAEAHWSEQGQNKPLRVAYICPNQNVASQNAPKFQNMYSGDLTGLRAALENALDAYRNGKAGGSSSAFTECQKEYLEQHSVYTRVCDWLIAMCDGKSIRDAMASGERDIYLPDERKKGQENDGNSISSNRESRKSGRQGDKKIQSCAHRLIQQILDNYPALNSLWNQCIDQEFPKQVYQFNKLTARYLTGRTEDDYRLSMQHLYHLEREKDCSGLPVQFESLTPPTSFSVQNRTGTYQERALIYATLDHRIKHAHLSPPQWLEDMRKLEKDSAENYEAAYQSYKSRLENLGSHDPANLVPETLWKIIETTQPGNWFQSPETCPKWLKSRSSAPHQPMNYPKFKGIPSDRDEFIIEARKAFISNNAKNFLNYDLVIMDEFQNFSELVACGSKEGDHSDASTIAHQLFDNKQCKVLLLSATPFSVDNYIPEGAQEEPDDKNIRDPQKPTLDERNTAEDLFGDFKKLIAFMKEDSTDIDDWINNWLHQRKDPEKCRKLLHNVGIFRTERNAAALHSPVVEKDLSQNLSPSFLSRLQTNVFMSGNSYYRSSFGNSTPYPLVFGAGYKFSESFPELYSDDFLIQDIPDSENLPEAELYQKLNRIKESFRPLFLTESQLLGTQIDTRHARFEALKRTLFAAADGTYSTEGQTKYTPASMLWIPPCKHDQPLGGAFTGREGFSKTLIFSHFRMTTMAFTHLLCNEAAYQLPQGGSGKLTVPEDYLKDKIAKAAGPKYEKTICALTTYFKNLFASQVGIAAVRSVYPNLEYSEAVKRYCEDGCFPDMIREYVQLLEAEYKSKDYDMSRAVSKATDLRIARPNLILLDSNGNPKRQGIAAANRFAVGLFPENDNGSDLLRRMGNIKSAFNSPFWPFVFTTTSIGAEGIDLHWYARNIVHWDVPARPLDIEQREGRVMRYRCHAFRLNEALADAPGESECVKKAWQGSGMYEAQLNYWSDSEDIGNGGCYHVVRYLCFEPESQETELFQTHKKIIAAYRSVLGTSGMNDLSSGTNTGYPPLDLSPWAAAHGSTQ